MFETNFSTFKNFTSYESFGKEELNSYKIIIEICSINCDKETKLLINFCNICGFNEEDYEDIFYDLLPKIPDYFEKKHGMDYYFFAIKNLANYKKIPK